jgi:recombinational DNA repair ATPase RecF
MSNQIVFSDPVLYATWNSLHFAVSQMEEFVKSSKASNAILDEEMVKFEREKMKTRIKTLEDAQRIIDTYHHKVPPVFQQPSTEDHPR